MDRYRQRALSLILLTMATAVGASQAPPEVRVADVGRYAGLAVTICERVIAIQCAAALGPLFLELQGAERVSVMIPPAARPDFEPRRRFVSQQVCASGQIQRRGSAYAILVNAPDQLRLVGDTPHEVSSDADPLYDLCDPDVSPPVPVRDSRPHYTSEAMKAKIQGAVELEAVVRVDGSVDAVRIVRSLDSKFGLDAAAIEAFTNWRFTPATRMGQKVPFVVRVDMTFTLR